MRPLCPFPMGATRSMSLMESSLLPLSSLSLSYGNTGVRSSKSGLLMAVPGSSPLTVSTYKSAPNRSPSLGSLVMPLILSPVFKLNLRICAGDTYMSLSLVRKLENLKHPKLFSSCIYKIPSTSGRSSLVSLVSLASLVSFSSAVGCEIRSFSSDVIFLPFENRKAGPLPFSEFSELLC